MTVTVIFRNGFVLDVKCESYTVTFHRSGGLESLHFYNIDSKSADPGWIDPNDVICVYKEGASEYAGNR